MFHYFILHLFNDATLDSLRADIQYALLYQCTQSLVKTYINNLKNKYHFENYLPRQFKVNITPNPHYSL